MKDSLLKVKQISSFDKRRFIKLVGILDENIVNKTKDNIREFLSLSH